MSTDQPVPGRWLDSHCHLQDAYRPEGTAEADALAAAAAAGVGGLVCVGTDPASSTQALALVDRARSAGQGVRTWATIGLHPHDASQGVDALAALLEQTSSRHGDTVVAVGECGLDYHYDHSPRAVQRDVFAAQIELARQHGLALVVHCRDAWDDALDILRAGAPERVVLHCFTGDAEQARRCLDLGAFLSFSGIVTFANAQDVRDAAVVCPLDRLLVETDAPFLAPTPHRGRPNEPAFVPLVGAAVAAAKGISEEILMNSSTTAATSVFALY